MSIVWLALVIIFVIIEALTYQLICIWFAFGSIGALLMSFISENILYQMIVFTIISVITLILIRPLAKTRFRATGLKSNTESLIGKELVITEEVNNTRASGQGKINGMSWTVRSSENQTLEKGTIAVVERIEGVKLIVKEKE